jgi:hypothetical protein
MRNNQRKNENKVGETLIYEWDTKWGMARIAGCTPAEVSLKGRLRGLLGRGVSAVFETTRHRERASPPGTAGWTGTGAIGFKARAQFIGCGTTGRISRSASERWRAHLKHSQMIQRLTVASSLSMVPEGRRSIDVQN